MRTGDDRGNERGQKTGPVEVDLVVRRHSNTTNDRNKTEVNTAIDFTPFPKKYTL